VSAAQIEDEMHFLTCTAYEDIRARYKDILPDEIVESNMTSVVNGDGSAAFWNAFASMICKCKDRRKNIIANMAI
jgi:hypothetical protein